MRDVLDTLKKLPPKCAAVIEDQAVFIRRGAAETGPAHMPRDQVDIWNHEHGVSWAQVQAMIIGVTLGWDKDGADPDTHAEQLLSEPGPFEWTFAATLVTEIKVTAHTEAEALKQARGLLERPTCEWDTLITLETLDLIETTDPRA